MQMWNSYIYVCMHVYNGKKIEYQLGDDITLNYIYICLSWRPGYNIILSLSETWTYLFLSFHLNK